MKFKKEVLVNIIFRGKKSLKDKIKLIANKKGLRPSEFMREVMEKNCK